MCRSECGCNISSILRSEYPRNDRAPTSSLLILTKHVVCMFSYVI